MSTVRRDTTVAVVIYNWSCLKQGHEMVLNAHENRLVLDHHNSADASRWILIPNLANGATQGGYTLLNSALGVYPEQPAVGNPIPVVKTSDPYGLKSYCWTVRSLGGTPQGERLWSIHDHRQSDVMDNRGACEAGLDVHLLDFTAQDNQKWVIRRVP